MVPDANALQAFNAPGARTWAATADALGMGFSHLHSIKVLSIIAGGILGLIPVSYTHLRGIDHIRDLRDNVRFAPSRGNFRIVYIDEDRKSVV